MKKRLDLLNHAPFTRLTVIAEAGLDKNRNARWKCRCVCGKEVVVLGHNLVTGLTRSCGCLRKDFNRVRKNPPPELLAELRPLAKRRVGHSP